MIANARMYAVAPEAAAHWRTLLSALLERAGVSATLIDHAPPEPIETLWRRADLAAVFMCGLPFALAAPSPVLIAAPVPRPAAFGGQPRYFSQWIAAADGGIRTLRDSFGGRLALTAAHSYSGYIAPLAHLATLEEAAYGEVIAPCLTPLGALRAVALGEADVAPVDAYAWYLLERYGAELVQRVRIVERTPVAPIPALVASPGMLAAGALEALRRAFAEAHESEALKATLEALLLERFVLPEAAAYAVLRDVQARTRAYWRAHRIATRVHPGFRELSDGTAPAA